MLLRWQFLKTPQPFRPWPRKPRKPTAKRRHRRWPTWPRAMGCDSMPSVPWNRSLGKMRELGLSWCCGCCENSDVSFWGTWWENWISGFFGCHVFGQKHVGLHVPKLYIYDMTNLANLDRQCVAFWCSSCTFDVRISWVSELTWPRSSCRCRSSSRCHGPLGGIAKEESVAKLMQWYDFEYIP